MTKLIGVFLQLLVKNTLRTYYNIQNYNFVLFCTSVNLFSRIEGKHISRKSENRVLRIFGLEREEITR
jgi:hypothetical protein